MQISYCAYFYYVNKLYVHVCVLERAKHSFFALPNPLSCSVMNKICLHKLYGQKIWYLNAQVKNVKYVYTNCMAKRYGTLMRKLRM